MAILDGERLDGCTKRGGVWGELRDFGGWDARDSTVAHNAKNATLKVCEDWDGRAGCAGGDESMSAHVIILGASTRAAAFSAARAGLSPWCVDLFADADLSRRFPVRKVPLADYPHALLAALNDAPPGPVIYTGGLENHPSLLERIARPLWGN